MAVSADQPLIAALDIGSSKVGALICTLTDDGRLQVLGTGQRESRGVKRGYVTDHPALYTIDGVEGVKNPIGLHAARLGVDIHVVAADPAPLRNIDYVIRSAHLGVKSIVSSPVAAALACLTEDERDLGVALV